MPSSFKAYIDESGDDGFNPKGSKWFVLSALVTPESKGIATAVTSSRDMKCYIVSDFELHGLSNMNGSCTFCVGMTTAFLGVAGGILTSAAFSDPKTITPEAKLLAGPGFLLVVFIGVAFAIAAVVSYLRASGAIRRIKSESKNN